ASAIAPEDEAEQGSLGDIRLMQFVTNTPQDGGDEAPTATTVSSSGGFPTNTPLATDIPPATDIPAATATPIPTTADGNRQRTPVALPTFFPPADSSEQQIAGT